MRGIHKVTLLSSSNSMCLLEKVSYWEELHEENYSLLEKDTENVARNRIRRTRESEKEGKRKTGTIHQLFKEKKG